MMLKRIKPYKAKPPKETVDKIKNIFLDLGFSFIEKPVCDKNFFSACVLSLINPRNQKEIFSTYGKGNNREWALASAWGEMIERFQNLAFFMIYIYPSQPENAISDTTKFKYYPDEKILTSFSPSFVKNYKALVYKNYIQEEKYNRTIGVPFVNIINNKTEFFPFRVLEIIVGSNGMCSGNTKEEALIQGISEVFERYVLKELYLKPFCPPDIPLEFFDGYEIQNKVKELIDINGYQVQIKDCSMGKGYPVIGVLVQNRQNEYAFHLGADPSPITALERCFTEMYQGGSICFLSIKELEMNMPFNLKNGFWKRNFSLTISAYAGHWSKDIICDCPSYSFTGFDHPSSVSDVDDLNYLLKILDKEKRKVFVRDNSFLGQPTFYIYIPEMSEITCYPDNLFSKAIIEFDRYLHILTNIQNSNVIERTKLLEAIKRYSMLSPYHEFRANDYLSFFREHPIAQLGHDEFISLLSASLMEKNIEDFYTVDEIISNPFLQSIYKNDETLKLTGIFKKLKIPHCFNCSGCRKSDICNSLFITEIWGKVRAKMELFYRN
jgi:ribosomal protein S12 methylthiotransferase accessory factor